MTLQPGTKLGNYELVDKIGAGGMGAVYKAYQPTLGRFVAIKVLPPQVAGDATFADRFAQEAKAIGKLRHPNIVTAFDFAHEGDIAFLVSEFVDGGTLADQLGSPLPLDYVLGIIGPMAAALDYAHARGVVHRDIKPQNVLLSHDGVPVLTDFGLAKIVGPGSGMTQAGSLMGTAEYIAPECAGGEPAGPPADQYALGLIAYQMLTGRHPFPSDNPLSALMAHVHKPVPIPSTLGVTLPPGTEAALLRVLAKRPEERFPRCSDFVKALAGSTFAMPSATAFATSTTAPASSPSQPNVTQTPSTPPIAAESPILSPASLVSPIERPASTPPTPIPASVAAAASAVPAGATAVITPPRPMPKGTPWWRSRKMLIVPALLVLLFLVNLPRGEGRVGGVQGTGGTRTQQPTTAPTTAPTAAATQAPPSPTLAPTQTVPVVVSPSPTVVRTPTPAPTATTTPPPGPDDHGNTPQTATAITQGQVNRGAIDPGADVDWFRFSVPANTQIVVDYKGGTLNFGAIGLFVAQGTTGATQVGADDVDNGTGASIVTIAREAGVYFVRVRSTRGDTGTYTMGVGFVAR